MRKWDAGHGFTLIELLVVLAIVAILAAVAVPAYTSQTRRSHRADAVSALSELQLKQERYRATHASYASSMDELLGSAAATTAFNGAHAYYDFVVSGASATGYTLTANAQGDQAKDSDCNPMVAAQAAGITTRTPAGKRCWN
jgi:type IV pilus assembly protein PilE